MSDELNEHQQAIKGLLESRSVRHNPENVLQYMMDSAPIAVGSNLPDLRVEVRDAVCTCEHPDCETEKWYAAVYIMDDANEREFLVYAFDRRQLPAMTLEMGDDGQLRPTEGGRVPNEMILAMLSMLAPEVAAEMREMTSHIVASTN